MTRKALIVGINDYQSNPLLGAINDALALAKLLAHNEDGSLNFDVRNLLSNNIKITRGKLRKGINELFHGAPDIAFFYFSGHGYFNSYGGYIVTPDYAQYDEGVAMDEILKIANESTARNRLIVLDCCHSGIMGSPSIVEQRFSVLADGVTVLAACQPSENAIELGGKGLFTGLLIEALKGGSADLMGHISINSIHAYIDRALSPWEQRPVFKTNISRFVSLRNVAPPITLKVLRKICQYFNSSDEEYRLDPSYEETEPNSNPKNVAIFKDLQKMERVGLVVPIDEEHMYYAAIRNKTCRLTPMGIQYWKLAFLGKL